MLNSKFLRSYLILSSNSILLTVFEVNLFQFFLGSSFFFMSQKKIDGTLEECLHHVLIPSLPTLRI